MDRNGEYGKKLLVVVTLLLLVASALVFISPGVTQAVTSPEADDYGYRWTDSNAPDPVVEYDWIDVKNHPGGIQLYYEDVGTGSISQRIFLGINFPFYNASFDQAYVNAYGYISFDANITQRYSKDIPNTPEWNETTNWPNLMIAAAWCNAYTNNSNGGIWYMTNTAVIDPYCVIEWNTNQYEMTFELILYQSGLIKMQYKDTGTHGSYSEGYNVVSGLESVVSGTLPGNNETGVPYTDTKENWTVFEERGYMYSSYTQRNLKDELAVEFSTGTIKSDVRLLNGDGQDGFYVYAEHKYYDFMVNVEDSNGPTDITNVKMFFEGFHSTRYENNIGVELVMESGLPTYRSMAPASVLVLDKVNCSFSPVGNNATVLFRVMFKFGYAVTGNNSIVSWARGKNTVPCFNNTEDLFYFENEVRLAGPLVVTGEFNGVMGNNFYTRENESVTFTGLKLIYNNSCKGIYPPNSSYFITLADYDNSEFWKDVNVSGRNMSISLNMPVQAIKKTFAVVLEEMAPELMLDDLPTISLIVDNSPPPAPQSLVLRADSYKDKNQELDNDDVIYVTWSPVSDLGSGVERYRISTTYSFNDPETPSTGWDTTKMTWNGTEEGDFKLFVWAEDEVGHYGAPAVAQIFIDKKDIEFYYDEFRFSGLTTSELNEYWIKTVTPGCTAWIMDLDGSGVDPDTAEYSISTGGIAGFEEWKLVDLTEIKESVLWDDPFVVTSVKPRFVEGTDNYIRYRAKDLAGNGYTESQLFKLNIDVTKVNYEEVFPTVDVWHDRDLINKREVSTILVDETSGIDTATIYYRVSTSMENGNRIWDTGIQQEGGWKKYSVGATDRLDGTKRIFVHFPFDGFKEGDNNVIQFRAKDLAGIGNSEEYPGYMVTPQIKVLVNTVPIAVITSPVEGEEFMLNELISFDGSGSYDNDEDTDLRFEWRQILKNGSRILGEGELLENKRFQTVGNVKIALYVGDSIHRYNEFTGEDRRAAAYVNITIRDIEVPTMGEDNDGDLMDDYWEWLHQLDWTRDDSDEDPDNDGYTNLQEFLGADNLPWDRGNMDDTDPRDPSSRPNVFNKMTVDTDEEAPFQIWVYLVVLMVAIIITALIVLIGYTRAHKGEENEEREEAEEEAMLATPQIEIPSMPMGPAGVPMVDTSTPALPAPQGEMPQAPPAEPMPAQPMQ